MRPITVRRMPDYDLYAHLTRLYPWGSGPDMDIYDIRVMVYQTVWTR